MKASPVEVWNVRKNLYQYCPFLIICKPIWSLINDKLYAINKANTAGIKIAYRMVNGEVLITMD